MRTSHFIMIALLAFAAVETADAGISYSDVQVETDFGEYSVFSMGGSLPLDTLYFHFPEAFVGDDYDPIRAGSITVSFNVQAEAGMAFSDARIRLVGDLYGLGQIDSDGVVDDLTSPGAIATENITLNNPELPYQKDVYFSRFAETIRVTQTFDLQAQDGVGQDLANLRLVSFKFNQVPVPEAGSLTLLCLGALVGMRRR